MATPVLGPETRAENKNNNVNLTRIEKERLERLKKLNPEVPKERTLMGKLVDQLRKSLTGKNLPKDVALAERRLQAGNYGSMDDDTYDPASMRKKPKSNPVVVSQAKRAQAASNIRVEKEADRLKKLKLKTDAKEEEARVKRAKEVALAERRLQAGKYGSMDDDTYDPASMRKKPEQKVNTSRTPREVALAERRLQAGKYGEIEEGNPASMRKKPEQKVNTSRTPREVALAERRLQAGKYGEIEEGNPAPFKKPVKQAMPPQDKRKVDLANVPVPTKPKTIGRAAVDNLKSVPQSLQEEETEKRSSVKPIKKKRDRLFGLDFLPEIDSKEGGDKINLPFGLGSYETLPIKDDLVSSRNKKGGRINRKSGGKIRKAGCKRGMGKAMRGY
jgi:hypothetical protein